MKTIALYDKTCSLCKETKRIFKKFDWLHKVEWVSLQEYEKKDQAIPFDYNSLRKELHIITSGRKVLTGFYAVRYLLTLFPATMVLGAILYIPGMSILGTIIYKWIAKNRHKILRKKCDNGSCSL
ncbi:DUF393 domain-containing protein [Bacillus sp. FJAT-49705]|uniref:DUF393 domain-containing protein n=1 Tax=Cytobacillus citreus TaxID=2833586 RepID=A0ABS5NV57_9BACI|nr:DUF393 domain-containing protein [Cytobacillus citreus]MBS4191716.1 DUF393 domain-containing protein [Cytobacillus citreus]